MCMGLTSSDFWQRVKILVKNKNIKQEAVCAETGISLGTLRGWITHSRFPDAEQAVRIARSLGTTVEYLVTGKEPQKETKIPDDLQAIINKYAGGQ